MKAETVSRIRSRDIDGLFLVTMAALCERKRKRESSFSRGSRRKNPIDELFFACLASQKEREREKQSSPLKRGS